MKKYILSVLIAFAFLGCSQRSDVINLSPYQSNSSNLGFNRQIHINSVTDMRQNKSVIATITDSKGSVSEYVTLQNDIKAWLQDGITNELVRLDGNVSNFSNDLIVDIKIVELRANLSGYGSDNLKGNAKLLLTIKKGETTITKNVAQSQTKFALIHTSGVFDKFLNELLSDIVKRAALQIIKS